MSQQNEQDKKLSDPRGWVEKYGDYLYNYAFMRLRDKTAAEDAVQETFLAALKARDRWTAQSAEITWFIGILKHKVVDHIRRAVREESVDQIDQLPVEKEGLYHEGARWKGHWIPDRGPTRWGEDPHKELENKEFRKVFMACLEALPGQLSRVFTLYTMQEMATEKVCNILDITATNLRVMLHRTRRQLRRCLEINWIGDKGSKQGMPP
jgi:RNA polymerase sigma-70 factor (ECF subfamily)